MEIGLHHDPVVDLNVIHIVDTVTSSKNPIFSYDKLAHEMEWIKSKNPELGVKAIAQFYQNIQNTRKQMESGIQKSTNVWMEDIFRN